MDDIALRGEIASLRAKIEQAVQKHPGSRAVVDAIALKLESDQPGDSPDLKRVLANLQERARALIERHPDVEGLFEGNRVVSYQVQQVLPDMLGMPATLRKAAISGTVEPRGPMVLTIGTIEPEPPAGTAAKSARKNDAPALAQKQRSVELSSRIATRSC